ncbi:E3 ubiquitin-protein ligase TRIM21-like [Pholidichthys leucotaenia]
MASATSLMAEENFLCSICLDVFKKPVSVPCGHNFCHDCIAAYWDTLGPVLQCPLCNENFYTRPMLRVNTFIADMAEKFNRKAQQRPLTAPDQAGNGNVLCDRCEGVKLPALKSCLVCFMSYCQTHLDPHQKNVALKKHKLIHPVQNLESRICKIHGEPFDLFCQLDKMFLCGSCKDEGHKKHKIVTLEHEAEMIKADLGLQTEVMDQMIQTRQQKILEFRHSLQASKNNAGKALSYSTHVMTAMADYITRSHVELSEVIKTKQKNDQAEADGVIDELEEEIEQIKKKNLQLSKVCLSIDPFTFLENFHSLTITSPQLKDWSDVTLNADQLEIQGAIAMLETTITREIVKLCDPNFKEYQRYAVDLTLDPDTANSNLYISEDLKQVSHVNQKKKIPSNPARFDNVLNVLAKEGFSSGKFYYEVQVKDKTEWDLGVSKESINRKGDIRLSPRNGYWTIWLRRGKDLKANAEHAVTLNVREMPQKIGVFVDYEAGEVFFYNVDTRSRIFSFTGCNFTEKLFPFFSPCASDGGRNSAPLIIMPVKKRS